MNDPNGLSFVDGVWHAYYQHNPDDDVWGPMHWRHATSPDLVTWTDHGIVLWPGPLGAAFSGSVVVDEWDSAGFGAGARVAVFTLDLHHDQRQGLAWSTDGFTWNLYDGNPVLTDPTAEHFRDPKVVRFEDRWVMALAVGPEIRFYRSPDLKKWEQTGVHQPDPRPTNPIECPDLVPLRTDAGEDCWLLIRSFACGRPATWTSCSLSPTPATILPVDPCGSAGRRSRWPSRRSTERLRRYDVTVRPWYWNAPASRDSTAWRQRPVCRPTAGW